MATESVTMHTCSHCGARYLEGRHDPDSCEQNSEVQRKQFRGGSIEYAEKRVVLGTDSGGHKHIVRMYWYHSRMGEQEIDVNDVLDAWEESFAEEKEQWLWPKFLKARGFVIFHQDADGKIQRAST